jgi:hypothetical protein
MLAVHDRPFDLILDCRAGRWGSKRGAFGREINPLCGHGAMLRSEGRPDADDDTGVPPHVPLARFWHWCEDTEKPATQIRVN